MLMADSSGQSAMPSTATLQVVIVMLTMIIKIGKYLPFIVFATSTFSLALAVLNFVVWDNLPFGVLNTILAVGGFVFVGQLLQKHKIKRRKSFTEERQMAVIERPDEAQPKEVQPRMNMVPRTERQFKDQAAA